MRKDPGVIKLNRIFAAYVLGDDGNFYSLYRRIPSKRPNCFAQPQRRKRVSARPAALRVSA